MTLLLDNNELADLISAGGFVEALDKAYTGFAAGEGVCAPRIDVQSGQATSDANYQLGLAVGMSGKYAALRIKSDLVTRRIVDGVARKDKYCVEPGTYMGLVLLFDASNGNLLAIVHDGLLQKMRVGADSALGIRYLARQDAKVLGLLGSGGMARAHVAAISTVRPLELIRIYSPNRENREAFAREVAETHGIETIAVDATEKVYADADIVSSCASAIGPVIHGRHLQPGMHVTCIGGTLDQEANDRVDIALRFGLAPAPAEAPDLAFEAECMTFAQAGGKAAHGGTARYADIPDDRRIGLADLLAQPSRGRTDDKQITFSERGNIHGLQFAAVVGLLYEQALAANVGRELPTELFLQSIRN
jgi:alanine dehydrogenase